MRSVWCSNKFEVLLTKPKHVNWVKLDAVVSWRCCFIHILVVLQNSLVNLHSQKRCIMVSLSSSQKEHLSVVCSPILWRKLFVATLLWRNLNWKICSLVSLVHKNGNMKDFFQSITSIRAYILQSEIHFSLLFWGIVAVFWTRCSYASLLKLTDFNKLLIMGVCCFGHCFYWLSVFFIDSLTAETMPK